MKRGAILSQPTERQGSEWKKRHETRETAYARLQTCRWLACAAADGIPLDDDFFQCLFWALGSKRETWLLVAKTASCALSSKRYAVFEKEMSKGFKKLEERSDEGEANRIELTLEEFPEVKSFLPKSLQAPFGCRSTAKGDFALGARRLRKFFGLNETAVRLAEFTFINQSFKAVESYFEDELRIWKRDGRSLLARLLHTGEARLRQAFADLRMAGLIDKGYDDNARLGSDLEKLWEREIDTGDLFCRPLRSSVLPLDKFSLRREDVDHILALLRDRSDRPTHILLYGHSGAGKTSFARALGKACGGKVYAVASRVSDDEDNRRASLMACLHLSSQNPGSLVLVDEAERLLDTDVRLGAANKDKAWLNDLLETPGRRVIWITNRVEHLDTAVLRRFSLSLHFGALGRRERLGIWRQIATDQRVTAWLPEQALENLAREYEAPAAVIREAVSQAKALYRKKTEFLPAVERVLRSHATLQNYGMPLRPKEQASPNFRPEGVSPAESGSVETLLAACRRADARLRSTGGLAPGEATLLFYGPPGTGKTALARHIAHDLDRECFVQRGSDLLDPFVGMTEQNIAHAFAYAETQGAVLLIDEVDSFLFSRTTAQHSWETSMVNEFLTALENCRCLCICTTNGREQLDKAAMRRFAHKTAFGYAGPEQARILYKTLLAPLVGNPMTPEEEQELCRLPRLAPGDFHVVRTQYASFFADAAGGVTHAALLAALRREMNLKLEEAGRPMGFSLLRAGSD
jgi:SpoVK/Ycf46/Vps4 family AAA+-type ATPase